MFRSTIPAALVLGTAAVTWTPPAFTQSPSPARTADEKKPVSSDIYLQAHLIMLEGDKLKKNGDFAGAYFKYRDARDIFDSVHASDPSWNPEIVEYRRGKIRGDMESMRQSEIERRAAGGEVTSSGVVGAAKPGAVDIQPAIPAKEAPAPPRNTAVVVDERVRALTAQMQRLEKRNEEVLKTLGAREEELRGIKKELLDSRTSESKMREKLLGAQSKLETAGAAEKRKHNELIKQVAGLQAALKEATDKLSEANGRVEALADELSKAYAEIKSVTTERDGLQKERDQMLALLNADSGPKGMEKSKILHDNQRLKSELAAAQAKVQQLSKEKDIDRQEITRLKEQLTGVQESLAALQVENEDYRQQIASLSSRLEATARQLANNAEAGALPESEAVAENMVLREIILQQMKQQSRRETARKNLMDELGRDGVLERMKDMGVDAETLLRSVNDMAAPVALSKAQRDAITSTQINRLMTSADGKELYLVEDSAADKPPGELPPPTGAADKAGLSTDLKAFATAAEEQFRAGSFSDAGTNFRKILVVEPQNVYALCNLGVTLIRQGEFDEASQTLKKALAYQYDSDFAHYLLGVACLRMGRLDEAVDEINEGLKLNDANASAHHTLGLIAMKRGRRSEAMEHFRRAVALDPACAEAHFNLAVFYATSEPPRLDLSRRHYRDNLAHGGARDSGLDKLLGK